MIIANKPHLTSSVRTISASIEIYVNNALRYITNGNGNVKSITIDRVGENSKFFGFGISQKATIVLLDRDKMYSIKEGDKILIKFDDVETTPFFYVSSASRNENTKELTLIAFDKLEEAAKHTISEIPNFTGGDVASVAQNCAYILGVELDLPVNNAFMREFSGLNVNGSETIREILDDIAEATQSVYYVAVGDILRFVSIDMDVRVQTTIDTSLYFTLETKENVVLTKIASVTDLGDNIVATYGRELDVTDGQKATQNVLNNAFWTTEENLATTLEEAIENIGGVSFTPYNCKWRGNYLLEPMDYIEIVTKDNKRIFTHLINDSMYYSGGYYQVSKWEYNESEKHHANPTTLGEALKDTYAKVDKANQKIELAVQKADANGEAISLLQLDTDGINATVQRTQDLVTSSLGNINGEIARLTESASLQITEQDVTIAIEKSLENGVGKVETSTGFTFNEDGLTVSKSDSEISTTITEDGMQVSKNNEALLTANSEGVQAVDLHATTYLIIGNNSRFEDMGNRTACFWIGG